MKKAKDRKLLHSMQHQYVLLVSLSILGTLLLCWLFVGLLSERVYRSSKIKSVVKVYDEIEAVYDRLDEDEAVCPDARMRL